MLLSGNTIRLYKKSQSAVCAELANRDFTMSSDVGASPKRDYKTTSHRQQSPNLGDVDIAG